MAQRGGLLRLAAGLERELAPAVYAAANIVEDAAKASIMAGSVSGKGHIPSAPGEPPNNDTGILVGHIETTQPEPLHTVVASNAQQSLSLEIGTSRMAARPFMGPAAFQSEKEVAATIAKGMTAAVRKLGAQ